MGNNVKSLSQLKPVERNRRFLSWKTKFDVILDLQPISRDIQDNVSLAGAHNRTNKIFICTSPPTWPTCKSRMSMIIGFKSYCKTLFRKFPRSETHVLQSNQDPLQNFLGEQRAQNSQAGKPAVLQTGISWSMSCNVLVEIQG